MTAILYIIPALACLLLHFGFRYEGDWKAYAWVFACGEATVGLLHWFFYRSFTSCEEFLGSRVRSIHYEAPWTEIVTHYETKTDSKGRTYTRVRTSYVYHPEQYYFHTTRGTRHGADAAYFSYVGRLWNVPERRDCWTGAHIRGGVRTGCHIVFDDLDALQQTDTTYWVPVTETHRYKNKIRCSNSIFKFEEIGKEEVADLGLIDYPKISRHDAPAVLSKDFMVPAYADDLFRKFNAGVAPESQMRLYILLFDWQKGAGISELQRNYWQGGNKNEFVVCVGLDPDGKVHWARAFSWADEPQLEVETAQWLMREDTLDWNAFYVWLSDNLGKWKRKEFKDFDYINVSLRLSHFLWILVLSLLENGIALWLCLRP